MEVRPFGIDVIVIEPGGTQSEWASVAVQEAERYSAAGAYSNLVAAQRKSRSWEKNLSSPKVITDLVVKALRAKTPRTRYHGATGSGQILFLRHLLSDRLFDRLVMSLAG